MNPNVITDKMSEMTNTLVESMLKLQEINDRTLQGLTRQQLETANSCVQAGVKQLRMMGVSNDPKDYLNGQVALATELGQLMTNHTERTMDLLNQSKTELNTWVSSNLKNFISVSKVD